MSRLPEFDIPYEAQHPLAVAAEPYKHTVDRLYDFTEAFTDEMGIMVDDLGLFFGWRQPVSDSPHPAFLGAGGIMAVFEIAEGVAAKLPVGTNLDSRAGYVREAMSALQQGQGIGGAEQPYGIIDNDLRSAVLSVAVPALPLDQLTDPQLRAIPESHFERLLHTFQALNAKQLVIDLARADNLLYAPEIGFTVIDYTTMIIDKLHDEADSSSGYEPQTISDIVYLFAAQEQISHSLEHYNLVPPHAVRFYHACERLLGQTVASQAIRAWERHGRQLPTE